MSALLVLALVVLAAPGPGRPEPESATRELHGGGNRTYRALLDSAAPDNATVGDLEPDRGLDSGNPFWDRLYWDCGKRTSLRCVQKSAFRFLKQALGEKDVFVTDSFVFRRNHLAVSPHPAAEVPAMLAGGPGVMQNKQGDGDEDADEDNLLQAGSLPTVEDLTDDLYDQGMSFIKSHDVHLRLPSLLGGAEVRLSPRAFEGDGATFKISFSRPHVDPVDPGGQVARGPRLFFNKGGGGIIKKITQKLFKKKLMTSFFALLLIIKMVKIKLMFLLPLLLGVGTAKKLLLKVLLFLFPALSHLFKLCSYYHANYAKYHHHHHKIAHHHHVIPVPVPQPVPVPAPAHHGDVYSGSPPPYSGGASPGPGPGGPHSSYGPPPSGPVYGAPPSGPGGPGGPGGGLLDDANPFGEYTGGYEYPAHNRNENLGVLPGNQQSSDLLAGWGLNHGLGAAPGWEDQRVYRHTPAQAAGAAGAAGSKRKQGVDAVPAPSSSSPARAPSLSDVSNGLGAIVGPTVEVAYDAFYSPLLQRMDGVFVQLGFNEEACRERLVCSMYKNPARFAPHSNLISAELSRDPSELQKPSSLNSAVVRFYRYVQAARDGQNSKDCLLLYPACTVNTEL